MKGFKDTSKMMHGHHFARGGHSLQPHFGHMSRAPGAGSQSADRVGGTTAHGSNMPEGNSAVMRAPVQPTEQLKDHGGKTPLPAGFKRGGKTSHFHVHKHYHSGGKVRSESKSYLRQVEGAAQMQAESGGNTNANGGFHSGSTGSSRPKFAKGGKMHIKPENKGKFTQKMTGSKKGHLTGKDVQRGLHSKSAETRKEANFARMARRGFKPLGKATGGTINCVATGGTINKLGAGGALYAEGGKVHSDAAQDRPMMEGIAKKVVKEHINYPEPRGHKGLGEAIRRRG